MLNILRSVLTRPPFAILELGLSRPWLLTDQFLPRDTMLAQYMLSFCVHPSRNVRICKKMAKCKITQRTPQNSSRNLVSDAQDVSKITIGSPSMGASNIGGVDYNRRFSTNISLHLGNG